MCQKCQKFHSYYRKEVQRWALEEITNSKHLSIIKIKNCKNVLLNKVLVTKIFIFNQKLLIVQIKYLNTQPLGYANKRENGRDVTCKFTQSILPKS